MESKKYDRKTARGILTPKERVFLSNFPRGRVLTSNERHYVSSIENKTRKALKDLNLIFDKLRYPYLLFSEGDTPSLQKPVEEVTEILYYQNYRNEFRKRLKRKVKRKIDKEAISQKTRKQLNEIINSVLNELQAKKP